MQPNTLNPVWNEKWKVKNVPSYANLHVEVMDKDVGNLTDDRVGGFDTTLATGPKEMQITRSSIRRDGGTFWLEVSICMPCCLQPTNMP